MVPCRWCSTPTKMLGTRMCDGCWELWHRVQSDTDLTARMLLAAVEEREKEE